MPHTAPARATTDYTRQSDFINHRWTNDRKQVRYPIPGLLG
jgi:hypothetical protein